MKRIFYKTNQSNPTIVAYKKAVEKGKKNQHILPYGDMWILKGTDSSNGVQMFGTQTEALEYAESVATSGTAVFIHNRDGLIKERRDC